MVSECFNNHITTVQQWFDNRSTTV